MRFFVYYSSSKLVVGGGGGDEVPRARRKLLGAKERTNNKLKPHLASTLGFEPRYFDGRRELSLLRHPLPPPPLP